MSEELNKLIMQAVPDQEGMNGLLGRLFETARPEAVFSQPVTNGDYTVITAAEMTAVFGAGYGSGGGTGSGNEVGPENAGFGSGGGGGGTVLARPVAAITIGPDGVEIEPIVDPTKIALAFFTAVAAMVMSFARMRRAAKG